MQITTFNPIIISKQSADIIALFEELGFERRHRSDMGGGRSNVDMVSPGGHRIGITQVPEDAELPRDVMMTRMNVRDFDEAYQILKSHGFINTRGDDTLDTGYSKSASMVSPTGFTIGLSEHFRKEQ